MKKILCIEFMLSKRSSTIPIISCWRYSKIDEVTPESVPKWGTYFGSVLRFHSNCV